MDLTTLRGGVELLIAKTGALGVSLVAMWIAACAWLAWDMVKGLWQMVRQVRANRAIWRTHDRAHGERRRGIGQVAERAAKRRAEIGSER